MRAHTAETTQACFYQIRRLRQFSKYVVCSFATLQPTLLLHSSCRVLTTATHFSRLCYYTSMAPLQRIHAAARLVTRTRHTSITLAPDRGLSAIQAVPPRTSSNYWKSSRLYMSKLLQTVSGLSTRRTVLRSASNEQLFIPRTRLKFSE